jgi:hypothetical protein
MATNYSVGHAMRRRSGIPSNPLEAAGKSMSRNHQTSDEAMQAAISGKSARIPMGATQAPQGTRVPRKNVQAGDPTNPGSKGPDRSPVLDAGGERLGSAYKVKAALGVQLDPAAGPTMANARIVPSIAGRASANFQSGEQSSY